MSRKNAVQTALVSLALVLASSAAHAGPIFVVNRMIGGVGSVVGIIETDDTIGPLVVGNILDWNLTLNDGTSPPFTLLGPLSGDNSELFISGSSFTAIVEDLLFDFSNVLGDYVLFQSPVISSAGMNFWCMEGFFTCTGRRSAETVATLNVSDAVFSTRTATVSVATLAAVPEPTTFALLGLGLAGIFYRRNKAA